MNFNINDYEHIIWDWNGTLLDDARLCVEIFNTLLTRRKMKTVSLVEYQEDFSFPVIEYYKKLGFDFDKESFDGVANEYIGLYNQRRFECKLNKGVLRVLEELKSRGLKQSILSAYHQKMLEETVDFYKLRKFFSEIVGLDDYYAHSKIDNGRKMLSGLRIAKSKIVLIGDTVHDYEVAEDMGISCILLCSGHCSAKRLQNCGVRVIDAIGDII
ncbi:MAG: HAD hydrolase-like protein [Phycisphaerae bacterium]|nr:HAD hydrolase-like protein [Phycisphaerae bacterium]